MSNQYNYHLPLYLITLLFLIINTAANATNISGHITQDDTLRLAGSPYVVTADVTVDSAVTLVIEAGVEINLAARDRDLKIYGTLIAEGTVQNSIRFYSSGGGNLGGSIEFLPGSTGNSMSYVEITQHRPYSIYNNARDCAVWIQEAEVSINHCEFVGNNKDVRSTVTSVSGFGSENDLTRIYLAGGTIASSTIWPNADTDGFEYFFTGDITVVTGQTLTIDYGVNINMGARDRDLKINGTLIAEGTVQDSISFYSTGAGNLGGSIEFLAGSTGSSMRYVEITQHRPYSIYNNGRDCAVWIEDAEVNINHCEFVNNNKDVRSTLTSLSGFGSENDLSNIYLATGTVDTNSIWPNADTDGFQYIFTGDVTVLADNTLTISPGVDVNMRFRDRDLKINGTLIAEGTVQDSIRFYSSGSGNLGGAIEFLPGSSGSSMKYVEITQHRPYSVYNNGRDCAVWIQNADVNINHCEFVSNNKDVRSTLTSLAGFGSENDLSRIYLATGTVDANAIWPNADTDGFQYIFTGDVVVSADNILTISPGVDINMVYRNYDFKINGTLVAEGTAQDSIRFYSSGSNGLGGAIEFLPGSSESSMRYVEITQHRPYSVYNNGRDCAVWIQDAEVDINHCEFVSNNKDIRSTLTSLSGLGSENDLNRIYLATGTVDANAIWPNADTDGFQYIFTGDVVVSADNILTISPGVDINMVYRNYDFKINGTLVAEGTAQDSIHFYSSGSNGLGGAIEFLPGSTNNSLKYAEITLHRPYSVYNNGRDCALWIQAPCTIANSNITNNTRGIRINANVSPIIRENWIHNNTVGIQISQSNNPNIAFNSIENNTSWGLHNTGDEVNACNNYWGDPTGPYNANNNPGGLGNQISDNVLAADCFLTEPTYVAINPTITGTSCIGDSDGSISLEVTGGTPPYVYEWSTGSTDTIISGLLEGDYSVTVTDADSLTAMSTYTIADPPQVTITVDRDTICFGDSIILTANFANTTNWSSGETTAQITVSPTTATTYYLSGEYAANCPYNDSISIEVTPYNPPGEVTDMLPANNAMNLLPPLNLSWIPTNSTTHYDLYIWQVGTDRPPAPTVADIAAINYEYTGTLEYATPYNWQLIAKNECFETEGVVQQFSLRELPDIVVSNISTPPESVFSGQTLSISWIVENTGLGQTLDQQWIDAVYISTDNTFEPGTDIYLGGISNFEALNPTENYLQTADLTLPNGIEGNYYVFVSTDHYGALLETNNDNNVLSSPGPILIELTDWPDLVVSNISILGNTTVFAGGTADIQYQVTNDVSYEDPFSGGTVIHSWKDRIHLSQDSILSGNDFLLKTITHTQADGEQMMAGESYTETHTVNIPNIFEENSTYFILVSTDIQNKVYEYLFDYNNTSASGDSLTLIYLPPNIRPTSITGPAAANNKDMISINWEVINDGVGTATNNWRDRVFLSPNSNNSIEANDVEITSQYQTADLAPGVTYSRQKTIIVPPDIGGTYHLKIFADANNNVNELDKEDDNILVSTPIDIQTADLHPLSLNTPNFTVAGQYLTIDWLLSNIGLGKINSSNWEDAFYLSPTSTFDENTAIEIDKYNQLAVLESGDSLSRSLNMLLPEDLAEGNYYWTIKANANNGVFENGDTLNNIFTSPNPIFIEGFPPADLEITQFNAPDTTLAGVNIPVGFTVLNNGPGTTSSVWIDRIYLTDSPVWVHPDSAILLKQLAANESIVTGGTYEQQTTLSLPMLPGTVATNTCYLYAFANSSASLYEGGNMANNILRSDPIHVIAPNTDLDVFCFMPSNDTIYSGSTIDISWTVENLGDSAGLDNYWYWYDGIYLSEDTLFDASDEFIFDYVISNTEVSYNSYDRSNQALDIPNGISGDYYLFMVADHTNLNFDTDFNNNPSLRTHNDCEILRGNNGLPKPLHFITPPSPDLSIQSFDAPMNGISGQPITVDWSVKNNGLAATANDWNDKIYLSTDLTLDEDDVLLSTHPHEGTLAIGDTYSVNATDVFLPIDADGIYVLIFATDADDTEYEHEAEANNILTTYITIEQPMPSDLIVTQITNPSAGTVGQNFDVTWTVQNTGTNPATGFMREAVYLSTDTIMDTDDVLVGILDNNINLAPLATATHTLSTLLPGIELGEYYILVETDLLNNILETDETNNGLVSDNLVDVNIPELPLNTLTPNILQNDIPLYYRVEIADSLYDETLKIELEGDSINGSNELYVSFAATPSRVEYEQAELTPFLGNQELIVPNLTSGTYYLMVHGLTTAAAQQDISLFASILEFGIRSVDANVGGNNGRVSVRIEGARFEEDMAVILDNGSAGIYIASAVYYIDPTTIYATFDLTGANLGVYDVEVRRDDGVTATLEDGFEIIEGSPPSLVISIDHPPNTRLNRIVPMTLHVVNDGLTDVPVREIYAISTQGAPLGRTVTELEEGRADIPIDLHIPGEPLDVIRPGGTVSVTFYTVSDSPMRFQLVDVN